MYICDRCGKGGNIRVYCFGEAGGSYPGLMHKDLCPACAKEFAQVFEKFTSAETEDDSSYYGTAEWQNRLKEYEEYCRRRGKA